MNTDKKHRRYPRLWEFIGDLAHFFTSCSPLASLAIISIQCRRTHACGRLLVTRWNSVIFLANYVEQRAYAEFAQFGSSSNCGLQFANRAHGVPVHRSMCGKVAC